MAIDPTKSSGAAPLDRSRIDQANTNQSARQTGQARSGPAGTREAGSTDDSVQLSDEARAAARTESTQSASGLSSDRLQEILKRLSSGYYDSPQVRDQVAQRIQQEWNHE
jgi:anti-sigma28 factor (negative regulator of flagellin synthesis)